MTYKASDKFTPYDWWFDQEVPRANYGSLQCWLYDESKQDKYINAYDMLIGSCLYNIQWGSGSEENLVRGQVRKP